MVALLSLWGAQTAAHQPVATMGALRPGIIWLNAWDLQVRIITVQPRNQPTNQPTIKPSNHPTNQPINPPPVWPVKAALFLGETATTSAKLRWVNCITLIEWRQLNTSWSPHFRAHMIHPWYGFRLDLFLEAFCVITWAFLRFGLYTWRCQYASL